MRHLNWNLEYYVSYVIDGVNLSTPFGFGFHTLADAETEMRRLTSLGATQVEYHIRKFRNWRS